MIGHHFWRKGKYLSLLSALTFLTTSCAVNLYSVETEKSIGKDISKQVEKEMEIVHIAMIEQYVDGIGQKLVQSLGQTPYSYSFRVIDEDEINAFALPGGYIFAYRGLLETVDDENQLASVLAHEIGHVESRHSTERISAAQGANFLRVLAAIVFRMPALASPVAELGEFLGLLKYSRAQEREADLKGAEYMTKVGYDPRGMVVFFQKLQEIHKTKPGLISRAFMTHPMTEDRIKTIQGWLEDHATAVEKKGSSLKFHIMKELLSKE